MKETKDPLSYSFGIDLAIDLLTLSARCKTALCGFFQFMDGLEAVLGDKVWPRLPDWISLSGPVLAEWLELLPLSPEEIDECNALIEHSHAGKLLASAFLYYRETTTVWKEEELSEELISLLSDTDLLMLVVYNKRVTHWISFRLPHGLPSVFYKISRKALYTFIRDTYYERFIL